MSNTPLCRLTSADFQKEIDGKKTDLIILSNKNKAEVAITNYGGSIVAIMVPDAKGNMANVIQGHTTLTIVSKAPSPF